MLIPHFGHVETGLIDTGLTDVVVGTSWTSVLLYTTINDTSREIVYILSDANLLSQA